MESSRELGPPMRLLIARKVIKRNTSFSLKAPHFIQTMTCYKTCIVCRILYVELLPNVSQGHINTESSGEFARVRRALLISVHIN